MDVTVVLAITIMVGTSDAKMLSYDYMKAFFRLFYY